MKKSERLLLKRLEAIGEGFDSSGYSLEMLVLLVQAIRPRSHEMNSKAEQRLLFLIEILRGDSRLLYHFCGLLVHVFVHTDLSEVLMESGINSEQRFFSELSKRLKHKILPSLKNKGSFLYAINAVFYKKSDYLWIRDIEDAAWVALLELIGVEFHITDSKTRAQLFTSMVILSGRISALGMESDVRRCLKESDQLWFLKQNHTTLHIVEELFNADLSLADPASAASAVSAVFAASADPASAAFAEHSLADPASAASADPASATSAVSADPASAASADLSLNRLNQKLPDELLHCETLLQHVQGEINRYGTSLHQTYLLLHIRQLIERMRLIIEMVNNEGNVNLHRMVRYFKEVVQNENTKNSLRSLLRGNVEFLAYRIAEHERNTGEHYITTTPAEYRRMLRSAMGGGVIISFIAVIKALFHFIKMAPFWQGFAYSVNYAMGFIGIYATGATLATKQPAMTASAIASSLDSSQDDALNLPELAILVSQAWRSQTISFVGNLMTVFPLTLGIALLWNLTFGHPIADPDFAQTLLDNQNPLKGLCLLYACFTGVFLYLSGIISGFFDNKAVYGNIPQRLREHPALKRYFSKKTVNKIADYTGKHLGGIMGNLCLGFFLGMAGFIGYIFGVSFDVRHITISTANFAIGLQGVGFTVGLSELLWVTVGVLLIGFLNFFVSFALAFFTALASRKVNFKHYQLFIRHLLRLVLRYPLDFIRPPKKQRKSEDFLKPEPLQNIDVV